MAIRYETGDGVEQSYEKAIEWYTKAANQNHLEAQFLPGDLFYLGRWVDQSYETAIKWFTKSADQGNSTSQFYLGVMNERGQGVKQSYENVWNGIQKLQSMV